MRAVLVGLLVALLPYDLDAQQAPPPPNVVLILADDAGWGDFGCYGQRRIRTPNIDRLAAEGLRFTDFYAGGTVCVPSRCALFTGKHPGHMSLRINVTQPLPEEELTLAEILQAAGQRTACIGKWALGNSVSQGSPRAQGFETYFGYIDQNLAHRYYPPFLLRDDERVVYDDNPQARTHYSQDLFTEEALRFLEASASEANRARPFFLFLSYCLPHADLDVPEDSAAPYRALGWPERAYVESGGKRLYNDQPTPRATYAGMLTRLDREVGRVLDALRELGLDENTLVLFSSDNGPTDEGGSDPEFFQSAGPFRGLKGELYEGGIRVPLIARWPKTVAPGTSALPCAMWDLLPTLVELAGALVPSGIDGLSLVPTLRGRAGEQRAHDALYWENIGPGPSHVQALRRGSWKAVRRGVHGRNPRVELYDLATDPGEAKDVAAEHAELVEELTALIEDAHIADPKSPLTWAELNGRPNRKPGKKGAEPK